MTSSPIPPAQSVGRAGIVLCVVVLFLSACSSEPPADEAETTEPQLNVILIVADDLGYGDLCAYGCDGGLTPNLDALASGGARFNRAYVAAPVCSPSRAALLTGRYQHRFGHEFTVGPLARAEREGLGTPTSEVLLPRLLQQNGFATSMVGKWHLGSKQEFLPQSRGFDEYFGFLHGANLYVDTIDPPGIHFIDVDPSPPRSRRRPGSDAIYRGREVVDEPEYLTDAFTREAVDFLRRQSDEPFFLYVAYNAPHTPLQVTDRYYDRFPHIEDEAKRIFAAMVNGLDEGVGRIVDTLRELKIEERTLVVFLSDNGCATYTGACSNGPYQGGKLTHFEGGTRVPFILHWPGVIDPGTVVDATVSSMDLLPTILEAVGVPVPQERPLDGSSLLPLLRGEVERLPRDGLFWRNGINWGALDEDRWKLVHISDEHRFVYDLENDPGETRDLSTEQPELLARMEKLFEEWSAGMAPPLWGDPRQVYISLEDLFAGRRLTTTFQPEEGLIELNL